jgi:2-dehydropantoate 2-reductase
LISNKDGSVDTITNLRATSDAASIGVVDLAIVFTKCYWTQEAIQNALPCIGRATTVLTLQNGWGNYEVISSVVSPDQIMVGVNYVSGTTLGPGHARQVGNPVAYVGRLKKDPDDTVKMVADILTEAGFSTTASPKILQDVFNKLALNVATLPTSAALRLEAHKLIENSGTINAMDDILKEMISVVAAQGVQIDFNERQSYIHNLLKNAVGAKGSMLQDVEAKRKTEIDVINGAIVAMGAKAGIPTPVNQTFVNLIKAIESTY